VLCRRVCQPYSRPLTWDIKPLRHTEGQPFVVQILLVASTSHCEFGTWVVTEPASWQATAVLAVLVAGSGVEACFIGQVQVGVWVFVWVERAVWWSCILMDTRTRQFDRRLTS
jgi:hypothetical protein